MALAAKSKLVPSQSSTGTPVDLSVTFTVTVVDRAAADPTSRTLNLELSDGNDLTFADGSKTFAKNATVGDEPVDVSFRTRIKGSGDDLTAFRVTLTADTTANLPFCMIRVE